jgi:putative PIN family toxin of toxin-antitoxin system
VLRAVLDANVFVSAAVRPVGTPGRLLRGFLTGEWPFELVTSPEIVDEVRRALAYPRVRKLVTGDLDPETWFLDLVSLSDVVDDTGRSAGISSDPDDDRYVAAAVEGRAQFIVTGDHDLLVIGEHEGIRVVSPRSFLDLLEARGKSRPLRK